MHMHGAAFLVRRVEMHLFGGERLFVMFGRLDGALDVQIGDNTAFDGGGWGTLCFGHAILLRLMIMPVRPCCPFRQCADICAAFMTPPQTPSAGPGGGGYGRPPPGCWPMRWRDRRPCGLPG